MTQRPILDSYWVVPGKLLAGEYPSAKKARIARRKLRRFLTCGVTFFLDLTEVGEYDLIPYAPMLSEMAGAAGRTVEHRKMPIRDLRTPTPGEMESILDTIDGAIDAGHVVYVHCYGGIGRTGTVVGCYLVRHGMDGGKALRKIDQLRQSLPDGFRLSPETAAQTAMVWYWRKGEG